MKKLYLLCLILAGLTTFCHAQWTNGTNIYNTNSGNVGIGTTNPTNGLLQINGAGDLLSLNSNGNTAQFNAYNNSDFRIIQREVAPLTLWTSTMERLKIDPYGNVGIGTQIPQAKLHVQTSGSAINAAGTFNGDVIIQGNTGIRSTMTGAALEFALPANTDGSNVWGQARIITVAGNTNNGDATGKLIMGTRRYFDKGNGNGTTWNYGDDLAIDGTGNIGIGTTNPNGYKLAVKGALHSKSVQVDMVGWSDFVFHKNYKLSSLKDLKTYIRQNHHLPDVPSEEQVKEEGIDVGEMNAKLLAKIEELTLYLIEKDREVFKIAKQMQNMQKEITRLKKKNKQ